MLMPKPLDSNVERLATVRGRAAGMSLPVAVERRNLSRREALVRRISAEFDEMPGLALSVRQASRFLGLEETACGRVLASLARAGVLRRNSQDLYVRRDRVA